MKENASQSNLGTAAPSQSTNLNPEQGTVRGNPQADPGVLETARASMETNGTLSSVAHIQRQQAAVYHVWTVSPDCWALL